MTRYEAWATEGNRSKKEISTRLLAQEAFYWRTKYTELKNHFDLFPYPVMDIT